MCVKGRVTRILSRLEAVEGGVDQAQGIEPVLCACVFVRKEGEAEVQAFAGQFSPARGAYKHPAADDFFTG